MLASLQSLSGPLVVQAVWQLFKFIWFKRDANLTQRHTAYRIINDIDVRVRN